MLRGMRDQRRCCVATLGDGASQLPEVYDSLHASLIIWIGARGLGWVGVPRHSGRRVGVPRHRQGHARFFCVLQACGLLSLVPHADANAPRPHARRRDRPPLAQAGLAGPRPLAEGGGAAGLRAGEQQLPRSRGRVRRARCSRLGSDDGKPVCVPPARYFRPAAPARTPRNHTACARLAAHSSQTPGAAHSQVPTGFGVKRRTADDKAKEIVGPLARGLLQLLKDDVQLPGRKLLYAELGYRGDWPNLMPAAWNPVMDRFAAVGGGEEGAAGEDGQQQEGGERR